MGEQQRSVEVDEMGFAGKQHSGSHRQRRTDHTADKQLEAELGCRLCQCEGFRQAAGLVEFDIDGIIAAAQICQPMAVMH